MSRKALRAVLFALAIATVLAEELDQGAKDIIERFLPYTPNAVLHRAFGVIYLILSAIFTFYITKRNEWWALCLPIGALLEGIGFFNRQRFGSNPTMGLYLTGDLFVTLAPVAYLAFNYIIFGRLSYNMMHDIRIDKRKRSLTLIPPQMLGKIFVWSDVLTFLAQTAGGLMKIDDKVAELGSRVILIGIAVQFLSYVIFLLLILQCRRRCNDLRSSPLGTRIDRVFWTLYFSSTWIILRSAYRVVELSGGLNSSLSKNQSVFFALDAAPLVLAIAIYVVIWPPRIVSLGMSKDGFQDIDEDHFPLKSGEAAVYP